ncbi:uncharacterized protein [Zea mays]|uniref:uncharacterized protein isoform X3 n=1 Tax=Zea mays TaxID=4577 RepID=UPI0002216714|nr:uncharacterized protein LOC103642402 isoform X3 [Zea mays]XP_020401578.1 uncharacterized protein LOC103642402 isoform X3 [Zea mays]XP_020401579.1 uncharacterized protein LOC103642402 isoform X3 [Zea mays]XP_035819266.1 uncharacterized protein LOC103642402 isoform X3 [Zea mays]|eukprot:XP_020401577.1 uncharacterized protein LOC103642402 [Zea mays]
MFGRGSPRINMLLSKSATKKPSPKAGDPKKHGGSPKEKLRAAWNSTLEKTLVDLLHEHKTADYRGQNGWTTEAWNKIVKEFHQREQYVYFTKTQIQDKERELKGDYRLLKDAKNQSGAHFDEKIGRITADPALWKNILTSHPKAKKFRNKSFPLYEALGELYDGQTAEGTYNYTSTQLPDLTQVGNGDEFLNIEHEQDELEEILPAHEEDDVHVVKAGDATGERHDPTPQRRTTAARGNNEEMRTKRHKKGDNLEGIMGRYIDMRMKQAEEEATHLAKEREEKEVSQAADFSIKKCISILGTMEVTKEEKAKAYNAFKDLDNRQIFLSACDDDAESALIWLRNEMA